MVNSGIWIRFRHGVKTSTITTTVKTTVIDQPTTRNLEAHQQLQQQLQATTTLYLSSNFARIVATTLKAIDTI